MRNKLVMADEFLDLLGDKFVEAGTHKATHKSFEDYVEIHIKKIEIMLKLLEIKKRGE